MRCASHSDSSQPRISSRSNVITYQRIPCSAFRPALRLRSPPAWHDGLTCNRRDPRSPDRGVQRASGGTEQASGSKELADAPAGTVPPAAADSPGTDSQESSAQRLFSNLNERTLRHEPGSVLGAAALVAGTTVGAGILALPYATKVGSAMARPHGHHMRFAACMHAWCRYFGHEGGESTDARLRGSLLPQDAGFVASSTALLGGAAFSAATGLLVAEVCYVRV